jgi:hypothetical protein
VADRPDASPSTRCADREFSEVCALALRERPFIVILGDIGTGGNPKMKINLADEIEQVTVAVDQPRKNGLPLTSMTRALRGDRDVAAFSHRLDAVAFDYDHRIFDR